MNITLIRTGGIMPIIKKATEEANWDEKEIADLIDSIKAPDHSGEMRDNTQYQLLYNDECFPIDFEKIPVKYKEVFERLKNNLKIVKPG